MSNIHKLSHERWREIDTRVVLDASPDLILFLAKNGQIHWANVTAADLLGVSRDALVGRSLFDFVNDGQSGYDEESLIGKVDIGELISGGVAKNLFVQIRTVAGTRFPALLSSSLAPVKLGDEPLTIVVSLRDMTDLLAVEAFWRNKPHK